MAADLPARLRRTGFGHRTLPQQKNRHAFALGREHQPAAGDKIEHFGIACDLQDHCAKAIAGQSIDSGAQGILCIGGSQHKKMCGIDAQFGKTCRRRRSIFEGGKILDDPEHSFRAAYALRGTGGKARSACIVGEDLVQRTKQKSTTENPIGIRMTKRMARAVSTLAQDGLEELTCLFQLFDGAEHTVHYLF